MLKNKQRLISTAALLALVGAGLSGCIVVPAHRYYGGGGGYVAEPAVVAGPGIWVDGYWGWEGGRRRWNEGHYERGDGYRGDRDRGGRGR